ncbi:hypothetical protein N0V93_005357 [Gnomoniopsis smithogilvyi]|uniref:Uncharacterized protein n=1 Tax=Gnomoniopsis smithogilvyi TaxID=1191159 RepID=A0A9W8YWF3_9PEZI|nr:hypothetical protein N0V93_005357 [Gnomoniopsis smithogilvyi]
MVLFTSRRDMFVLSVRTENTGIQGQTICKGMFAFITPTKIKTTVNCEMFFHKDQMAQAAAVEGVASASARVAGYLQIELAVAYTVLTAATVPLRVS